MQRRLPIAGADDRRLQDTRTTAHVIRKTVSFFANHGFTFIFLALVLLLFRVLVGIVSHAFVTHFVDTKPTPNSLLDDHRHVIPPAAFRRRFNFEDRTPLGSTCKAPVNATSVTLSDYDPGLGFCDLGVRNAFRVSQILGPTCKAPVNATSVTLSDYDPELGFCDLGVRNAFRVSQILSPGLTCAASIGGEDGTLNYETVRGFGRLHFLKELDSGPYYLVIFTFGIYLWTIFLFWVVYSSVLGIVFFVVVNDLLDVSRSFVQVVRDGYRIGHRKILIASFLMRWAVRETLAICIMLGTFWCFGEIEDWHSLSKMFLRLKLMPFSIASPSVRGFEDEISGLLLTWLLLDTVFACLYPVDVWVGFVDAEDRRKIVKSVSFWVMKLPMKSQASQVNCLEVLGCGSFGRWVLTRLFGVSLATGVQAVLEVYFMAAWLIFFLAAKCRDANAAAVANGMEFGQEELKELIRNLRQ